MRKPVLICIIGKTCSGKDTLSYILDIHQGIKSLVSYTTRPKRDYEDDGEEHYFITEEEYNSKYKDEDKLAYTEINGYKYFTLYSQVMNTVGPNIYTYVIDPTGYYDLKERFSDKIDIKTVLVLCDDKIREERYYNRENNVSIPFLERSQAESAQFDEFEKNHIQECDVVLRTDKLNLLRLIYD